MSRLHISSTPRPFPQHVIRAPVPWHTEVDRSRDLITSLLFKTHPVITKLQNMWVHKYAQIRFIQSDKLDQAGIPLAPEDFLKLVSKI